MNEVSISYLHECFVLDAERGILTWKTRPRSHFPDARSFGASNTRMSGRIAGSLMNSGYISIRLPKPILAHRIVWAMHTGSWPAFFIDHINRHKSDNRICNLREATKSQNAANTGPNRANKVGFKGVCRCGKRYVAQIAKPNGPVLYLGLFDTPELAHRAYCAAAIDLYGQFAGGLMFAEAAQ